MLLWEGELWKDSGYCGWWDGGIVSIREKTWEDTSWWWTARRIRRCFDSSSNLLYTISVRSDGAEPNAGGYGGVIGPFMKLQLWQLLQLAGFELPHIQPNCNPFGKNWPDAKLWRGGATKTRHIVQNSVFKWFLVGMGNSTLFHPISPCVCFLTSNGS